MGTDFCGSKLSQMHFRESVKNSKMRKFLPMKVSFQIKVFRKFSSHQFLLSHFISDIIAKDSFNTRYHLKIPRGERLRNLAFRTADDYIPIIKESGGGIMTIKALISSNEKWMKAFPVSFNHIMLKQIRNDKRRCKSCRCGRHREGHGVLQCSSSMATKC